MCNCSCIDNVRATRWINSKNWKTCPIKIVTTLYRIEVEYDYYKKIKIEGFNSLKIEIKKKCKFNENEWLDLVERYNEQKKNEEEDNYMKNIKLLKINCSFGMTYYNRFCFFVFLIFY